MRTLSLLALATIASLFSVTRLSAQCTPQMNISVFADGEIGGTTVYVYTSTVDNSALCTCVHSDYQTAAILQVPNGSYLYSTNAGDTSSLSTSTVGDGSYYASGAVTLNCTCYGTLGAGGGSVIINPPAPTITGIADSSTWSNTIYQGASGYLAIFGTSLTAMGQTPMPMVSGDSAVVIGSISYASDTQVNVSYTVTANAALGAHNVLLQTAKGSASSGVGVSPPPSLYCPALVTRGSSATCTISGAPANAVSSWTFSGGGAVVPGPAGALSWSGTMVATGNVGATVGGVVLISQQILVIPRLFWHLAPATDTIVPNGTFKQLPVPPSPTFVDSGLGSSLPSTLYAGFNATAISGGPNAGFLYYATQLTWTSFSFQSEINPDLIDQNSTFSTHQCGATGPNDSTPNPNGIISWINLLNQTERHEYGTVQSHWLFYSNSMNTNNPGDYFESRAALSYPNFNPDTNKALNNLLAQIQSDAAVEPYPVNYNEMDQPLGGVNYGPNYTPCN